MSRKLDSRRSPDTDRKDRATKTAAWRDGIVTASALRTKTFAPVKFVVPGLIPEGVTLLVSKPKQGKSWLTLDLCVACAADRFTLGDIKPMQGNVLCLALEDSQRRFRPAGRIHP